MKDNSRGLAELLILRILGIFSPIQLNALLLSALLPVMLFIGVHNVEAANHYIRAGATGSVPCSDWISANACNALPATLVRGDTYYIAGGNYAGYTFDDAAVGTTTITIKHATINDHGTATGWNDAFASQTVFTSGITCRTAWLIIDGMTGGGPGSWEAGFGIKVNTTSKGVFITSGRCDNVTFRHVDFVGSGRLAPRSNAGGTDVDIIYIAGGNVTNLTFQYSLLRDANCTHMLSWPNPINGLLMEYTKVARNGPSEHAECWSAGDDDNIVIRYSWWEDCMATGFIASVNGSGTASNWDIYGNIFSWSGNFRDGILNTGIFFNSYNGVDVFIVASNWHVYNNVFANIGNNSFTAQIVSQNAVNYVVENNIWYHNKPLDGGVAGTSGVTTSNYNFFCDNEANAKSGPNDIVCSTATSPFRNYLSGDWSLVSAIPGLNLGTPYNVDFLGNNRAADGVWDRGALEFRSGVTDLPPLAPTNIRVL